MAIHNTCVAPDRPKHGASLTEACCFIFSEERKEQGQRVWGAGEMGGASLPELHLMRRAPRPAHLAGEIHGPWPPSSGICREGSKIAILPPLVIPRVDYCSFSRHLGTRKVGQVFPLKLNRLSKQQFPGAHAFRTQSSEALLRASLSPPPTLDSAAPAPGPGQV